MTPEIKAEFQMFVPEDDGSAMDWLENTLTQDRAALHTSLVAAVEGLKQEIPTYLNKRGHHTNSAHKKIKYNQALDDTLTIINSIFKE